MFQTRFLAIFLISINVFFTLTSSFVLKEKLQKHDEGKRSESDMLKYIQALEEFSPKSQQETIEKNNEEKLKQDKIEKEDKIMSILIRLNNWLDFLEETLKSDGLNAILENFLEGDLQGRFKRSPRGWKRRGARDGEDEEAEENAERDGEDEEEEEEAAARRRRRRGRKSGRRNYY